MIDAQGQRRTGNFFQWGGAVNQNNRAQIIACCLLETFTYQLTDTISLQFMTFGNENRRKKSH